MTSRSAWRYALAILDSRPDDLPLKALLQDLQDIRVSVRASRELELFFLSPVISRKKKLDAVSSIFEDKVSRHTLSVLRLLVEKSRENILSDIIDAVFVLHRKREGIMISRITTAVELSEEQLERLLSALRMLSGKNIEAEYVIDPDILAGVMVQLDDTVYDGSARRQLQRLRAHFISS